MASQVDICNQALSHLGDSATVSSIDPPEGSAQAEHCARFYPLTLATLLEMHTWSFATSRASLALVTNPSTTWAYAYASPNQALSILSILASDAANDYATPSAKGGQPTPQQFVVEVGSDGTEIILTNQAYAVARYTRLVNDPAKFSALFTEALTWLLASKLAGPVLKGETGAAAAQAATKTFNYWLDKAKDTDADSRRVRPAHQVPWLSVR